MEFKWINEGRVKSDKTVHSFDIALSSEETLILLMIIYLLLFHYILYLY